MSQVTVQESSLFTVEHYGDHNLHDAAFSFSIATTRAKRLYTCTKVPCQPIELETNTIKRRDGQEHVQTNDGNKVPGDNLFLDPDVSTIGYSESADQWVNFAAQFKEEKRILLETEMYIYFLCCQLKTCVLDPIDSVDTVLICRNKDKPWFYLR